MSSSPANLDDFVRAAGDGKLLQMMKALRHLNDLNQQDSAGNVALCQASRGGHHAICSKLLMEYKVNVNARDSQGKRAIHHAAAGGHDKVVELFVYNGATANVVDDEGWSPLHHAAQSGNLNSVRALLRKGVLLNAQTPNGDTATHLAVLSSKFSLDVLKELSGWPGVRLDLKNKESKSALDVAKRSGNRQAVEHLTSSSLRGE